MSATGLRASIGEEGKFLETSMDYEANAIIMN
jgi:hypothetical protein